MSLFCLAHANEPIARVRVQWKMRGVVSRRTLKPEGFVGVSLLSPLPHISVQYETADLVVSRERGEYQDLISCRNEGFSLGAGELTQSTGEGRSCPEELPAMTPPPSGNGNRRHMPSVSPPPPSQGGTPHSLPENPCGTHLQLPTGCPAQ